MIKSLRTKPKVVKDSKSKGRPAGEGLNSPLEIKEGATGCVILEQDLVGECGSTKCRRKDPPGDENGVSRCSGLCKGVGRGSVGIQYGTI